MNVSPDALRKEAVATLKDVNRALENTGEASPSYPTLLLARAQSLNTLVLLNEQKR